MWQQWKAYLQGEADRPFEYAENIRARWRIHFDWKTYRTSLENGKEVEKPELEPGASQAAHIAYAAEGPRPEEPFTVWVESLDDLKDRNYDLSARNPNQDDRITLPPPAEITTRLMERTREFQSILENVHMMISNGERN